MYFELVLIYPALRFINDISLMNLSARTSRRPIYVAILFLNSQVLMFPVILPFHRFNLVYQFLTSVRFCFPVFVGTAKVEIFFNLSSFLFFIF